MHHAGPAGIGGRGGGVGGGSGGAKRGLAIRQDVWGAHSMALRGEPLSPYRVSLCVLVCAHVTPRAQAEDDGTEDNVTASLHVPARQLSAEDVQRFTSFIMREVHGHNDGTLHRSLQDLCDVLTVEAVPGLGGDALASALLATLRGVDSPDAVSQLLGHFESCLTAPAVALVADAHPSRPTFVERDSVLGLFIRRTLLQQRKALFGGASRLFDKLLSYVGQYDLAADKPSRGADPFASVIPPPAGAGAGAGAGASTPHWGDMLDAVSPDDARAASSGRTQRMRGMVPSQLRRYLEARAARVESLVGVVPRERLHAELEALLAMAPETPAAHLANYLVALHHNEYEGAVENLHRYFDYSLKLGPRRGPGTAGDAAPSTTQFAVMSLAAVHLWFGHMPAAAEALRESVRVAQQNRDAACVNFCLAMLAQVMAEEGDAQADDLLRRCRTRAAELRLWRLQALTTMTMSERRSARGDSSTARGAVGGATLSDGGAVAFGGRGTVGGGSGPLNPSATPGGPAASASSLLDDWLSFDPVTSAVAGGAHLGPRGAAATASGGVAAVSGASMSVPTGERNGVQAVHHGLRRRQWKRIGHDALADVATRLQLYCFGGARLRASNVDSLATLAAEHGELGGGGHGVDDGSRGSDRGALWGLQLLARLAQAANTDSAAATAVAGTARGEHGNAVDGAGAGGAVAYSGGLSVGEVAQMRNVAAIPLAAGMLWHHTSLARREMTPARTMCSHVCSVSSVAADPPTTVAASMAWANWLRCVGRVDEARAVLLELEDRCRDPSMFTPRVQCLLALAALAMDSPSASPSSVSSAIPHLLRCLALCGTSHQAFRLQAIAQLGAVLLYLGDAARAMACIFSSLPSILEHANAQTRAGTCMVLAKCYAATPTPSDVALASRLRHALQWLGRAEVAFSECQDACGRRDAAHLTALTCNRLLDLTSEDKEGKRLQLRSARNAAARRFADAQVSIAKAMAAPSVPVDVLHDAVALGREVADAFGSVQQHA